MTHNAGQLLEPRSVQHDHATHIPLSRLFPKFTSSSSSSPIAEPRASGPALTVVDIPNFSFPGSSTRKPANIPLHTLSGASRSRGGRRSRRSGSEESFDEKDEDRQRLTGRRSSDSFDDDDDAGSEFSLWSDTGDLVDQLADQEDPLAERVGNSRSFEEARRGRSHQKKQVRYADGSADQEKHGGGSRRGQQRAGVVRKEDIYIPEPPPQRLGWGQKLLATVMAPTDGPSRMHGLHGKKLIYFLSIFVSLGVFLFGYD